MQFKRSCILYLLSKGYLSVNERKPVDYFVQISFSFMILCLCRLFVHGRGTLKNTTQDFCFRGELTGQWPVNIPSDTMIKRGCIAEKSYRRFQKSIRTRQPKIPEMNSPFLGITSCLLPWQNLTIQVWAGNQAWHKAERFSCRREK